MNFHPKEIFVIFKVFWWLKSSGKRGVDNCFKFHSSLMSTIHLQIYGKTLIDEPKSMA